MINSELFKLRSRLAAIKVIQEDLKLLVIDIKHGNTQSALNWIKLIREGLKRIK